MTNGLLFEGEFSCSKYYNWALGMGTSPQQAANFCNSYQVSSLMQAQKITIDQSLRITNSYSYSALLKGYVTPDEAPQITNRYQFIALELTQKPLPFNNNCQTYSSMTVNKALLFDNYCQTYALHKCASVEQALSYSTTDCDHYLTHGTWGADVMVSHPLDHQPTYVEMVYDYLASLLFHNCFA